MKDKRILMILNEFPPTAQSGVQRGLKFLKYAVRLGWEAHVIAPNSPIRSTLDPSLMSDIPPEATIYRVAGLGLKTASESRMVHARFDETAPKQPLVRLFWAFVKLVNDILFPYDKQIGWMPFALIKAIRLINKHKLRNVYITAFPYSAFLVGIVLKRIYKDRIFWIADYRDAWQFAPMLNRYVLLFRYRIICHTDDLTLRMCDAAVFVTDSILGSYLQKHPELGSKFHCITNGYDDEDFIGISPATYPILTFVYMGKLHINYGNPASFFAILSEILHVDYQIIHIGTCDKGIKEQLANSTSLNYRYLGYKPHKEALSYSAGASINFIFLSDDLASESVYTGKLFELIRLGKPIFALGPKNSIIKELLHTTGSGRYSWVADTKQIISEFTNLLNEINSNQPKTNDISRYSRKNLTASLLEIFG